MATKLHTGDEFHLNFNPVQYLDRSYSSMDGEINGVDSSLTFVLENLDRIFKQEGVGGDRLIDIGTGPCIYSFVSACTKFKNITASDFTEANCDAIKRWVKNEPGCYDWMPVIKHVCQLENHSDFKEREALLRKTITDVVPCDVHQSDPLLGRGIQVAPFDCLTSCYCLGSACSNQEEYLQCLKNMASLLKSGGLFIHLSESVNFYTVGDKKFKGMIQEEDFQRASLKEAGFTEIHCTIRQRPNKSDKLFTSIVTARKL